MTDRAKFSDQPRWLRWFMLATGIFLALTIAIIILANATAPDDNAGDPVETAAVATTVGSADPAIVSTRRAGDTLTVTLAPEVWDVADYPQNLSMIVKRVGLVVQAGAVDAAGVETFQFDVVGQAVDRLGNESQMTILVASITGADMRASQFDNLSLARTLNLSTRVSAGPEGRRAIAAYCQSERGRDSTAFCSLGLG